MVQSVQRRRGEAACLTHAAAEQFANAPRLGDKARTGQRGAYRDAKTLAKTNRYAVKRLAPRCGGIPEATRRSTSERRRDEERDRGRASRRDRLDLFQRINAAAAAIVVFSRQTSRVLTK